MNCNHHARKERVEARARSEHAAVLRHACIAGAGPVMLPRQQEVTMQDSVDLLSMECDEVKTRNGAQVMTVTHSSMQTGQQPSSAACAVFCGVVSSAAIAHPTGLLQTR